MSDPIICVEDLCKSYGGEANRLDILKNVSFDIFPGDALCILGSSGAGKSTLLHLLGGLDRPTSGRVLYKSEDLFQKDEQALADFRNKTLGFVFQFHHLLPEFNALENIELPARIGGLSRSKARDRAESLLSLMGLLARKSHFPSQLSGGEQQRVAIARALVQQPELLLADEPTGNLDRENSERIEDLFFELRDKLGLTLVVVTHDQAYASRFSRRLSLRDGKLIGDF